MVKRKPSPSKSPPLSWAPWFYRQSGALGRAVTRQMDEYRSAMGEIYRLAVGGNGEGRSDG